MTVAGLRFRNKTYSATPTVTKNGVFIFDGNPADYHEWEFRTELRIAAFEQQEKRRKKKRRRAEKNRSSHRAVLKEEGPKGLLKRKRKLQREGKVSWGQYRHRTDPPHQHPAK